MAILRLSGLAALGAFLSARECRQCAAECLRLASAMSREEDRARLLGMAEAWRELAEKLEAQASNGSDSGLIGPTTTNAEWR